MNKQQIRAYDLSRDFSTKGFYSACYAPFVSMYFDQVGGVRACCQNTEHLLGNVAEQRLDDIWNSPAARRLREAVIDYDFSAGCQFCKWQLSDGVGADALSRLFDEFPAPSATPQWPIRMEFSVSNTCNLECIMCNGEWSSSIRSRREKLPPLPKAYDDHFFADLRKYLPHLQQAKFLGGEPFLAAESLRIWEMMVEDGLVIPCHCTTNGTQWNARVERILEALPVSVSISMDGVTQATVESIRVNAKLRVLRENFQRFHEYSRRRGTDLSLTFCLMTKNCHEFAEYLMFADSYDVPVYVNTVIHPATCSLFRLPPEELEQYLWALQQQDRYVRGYLRRNLKVWEGELHRLQHHLQQAGSQRQYFQSMSFPTDATTAEGQSNFAGPTPASIRDELRRWSGGAPVDVLVCDQMDTMIDVDSESGGFLSVPSEVLLGQPMLSVFSQLKARLGHEFATLHEQLSPAWMERVVSFRFPAQSPTYVRALVLPRLDEQGRVAGSLTFASITAQLPASVAVPKNA